MKVKHNKKRNTAFLYEVLVKELTRAVVNKDARSKRFVGALIKESFSAHSILGAELECYNTLLDTTGLELHVAEKLLQETKVFRSQLDGKRIFDRQTKIINKINKTLSKEAWGAFIPNFKSLATVAAIFNSATPVKQRVLHEDTMIKRMHMPEKVEESNLVPIDNLVYRAFVNKFNTQYNALLSEQKQLLGRYISSFTDNGLELKLYLSEEIGRLKIKIKDSLKMEEIYSDEKMVDKTKQVLAILEGFRDASPTQEVVSRILSIQQLVREIDTDD